MPHPIATLALSLAPFAADLASKIMNMKKNAKSKNTLEERIEKLENYEVEQAKLVTDLVLKVEYLQKQEKKLTMWLAVVTFLTICTWIGGIAIFFFTIDNH